MDATDMRILALLQEQGDLSAAEVARRLDLPATSCWRRIATLESEGVITRRVALVDPAKVGAGMVVFVLLRTSRHDAEWLETFARAVTTMPEVLEVHRLAGEVDYLLKVLVADIAGYDAFYRRLIARVPLNDVSASFSMERIKETTAVPLGRG
ncbi:MAG: Lrp/AsnC family transcriptional regulator [Alphaproteobacteria bacterium]